MVITYYIPAESFSRAVEHPCQFWIGTLDLRLSIFGRRQQIELKNGVPADLLASRNSGLFAKEIADKGDTPVRV
jgi:hypothetical protein